MFMRYFGILSLERAAVNVALRGGEPCQTFKTRSFAVAGKGGPRPGSRLETNSQPGLPLQ